LVIQISEVRSHSFIAIPIPIGAPSGTFNLIPWCDIVHQEGLYEGFGIYQPNSANAFQTRAVSSIRVVSLPVVRVSFASVFQNF